MGSFLIKAYRVSCDGFPSHLYYAASRARALRDSWNSYCIYREVTFKEFLTMSHCCREENMGDDFGAEISVGGKPAFFITKNNQYVQFSRPGEIDYSNAHPFDVEPARFRPWTYQEPTS